MEAEVLSSEMVLPPSLPFKRVQMLEKHPKGQSRGRHWKHLKQILQAENYLSYSPDEPNSAPSEAFRVLVEKTKNSSRDVNIESPPSMYPPKKYCDITGFVAPYVDPRTNLRYVSTDVFKRIRMLPNEYVQRYLTVRNAAVVLK